MADHQPNAKLSIIDIANRGYNLMTVTVLGLVGLSFGSVLFEPQEEPIDKVDDGGLLLVGIVAVIWYLIGRNRFSRSTLPVIFSVVALAFQIFGNIVERSDAASLGDNIGGSIIVVAALIVFIIQYRRTPKLASS